MQAPNAGMQMRSCGTVWCCTERMPGCGCGWASFMLHMLTCTQPFHLQAHLLLHADMTDDLMDSLNRLRLELRLELKP